MGGCRHSAPPIPLPPRRGSCRGGAQGGGDDAARRRGCG
uniref:Gamma-glutamyltranspeptidase 1 n=1 Tax=Arundo donax TaxID=35708 RepID=A0A0A9SVD9_ARUDO